MTGYDQGVARTRQGVFARLRGVFGRPMDDAAWEEVEEALIAADIGATLAARSSKGPRTERHDDAQAAVEAELLALFTPRDPTPWPRVPAPDVPAVVLVIGVNGTGKTTTVAKLGHRFATRGAKVLLAAGDTFRAAAIEQLETWAQRIGLPVIAHAAGADPSAVVYDALDAAAARRADVVRRRYGGPPPHQDQPHGGAGQDPSDDRQAPARCDARGPLRPGCHDRPERPAQAKAFHESAGLTGIALTKLDTTSRGGICFAIEDALKVPVLFVGVGEKIDDLLDFDPNAFVEALFA